MRLRMSRPRRDDGMETFKNLVEGGRKNVGRLIPDLS